jgi:hypothetical protein
VTDDFPLGDRICVDVYERPKSVEQGKILHDRENVERIQKWLIERGHLKVGDSKNNPDGMWGNGTSNGFQRELERIQRDAGIPETGEYDVETRRVMLEKGLKDQVDTLDRMQENGVLERVYRPAEKTKICMGLPCEDPKTGTGLSPVLPPEIKTPETKIPTPDVLKPTDAAPRTSEPVAKNQSPDSCLPLVETMPVVRTDEDYGDSGMIMEAPDSPEVPGYRAAPMPEWKQERPLCLDASKLEDSLREFKARDAITTEFSLADQFHRALSHFGLHSLETLKQNPELQQEASSRLSEPVQNAPEIGVGAFRLN